MAENPSLRPTNPNSPQTVGSQPSIAGLKTASDYQNHLERLMRARQYSERQWKLNLAFYRGRQYAYYSKALRRIATLPIEEGDKPRYRVRLVSNQIMSGTASLLSKFLKTKPRMMATPGTGADSDLRAAQFAEQLLEYWWDDMQLDDTLEEVLLWSIIGGQGYWRVCWDKYAAKQMTFLMNPMTNQPIIDEGEKDMFLQELQKMGLPPNEQTVYMGDLKIEVVPPFDLYVDPTVKRFNDAKYVIHSMYMDPAEIEVQYGKKLPPDSIPSSPDSTLPMGGQDQGEMMVRRVNVMYIKPNKVVPRGRIVTWSGKEALLEVKDWDYPDQTLPFVKFPGVRVPGEVYDSSVVEHAIPIQKELNRTLSQIVEFKNMTVKPQWIAPAGSLRQKRSDEPGAVFEFNPINGMAPSPIPVGVLPAYVFNHLTDLQTRLADIFGRMEVTEGSVPPNVEAGTAIELLQEMATDKIAPQIRLIELAIAQAGNLMLKLAQKYYAEPRMIQLKGAAGSQQVKQFTKADLEGSVNVQVEAGSGLPRTRAGRQARIESFISMNLIRPDQAWKYLDMADLHGIADQFAADEDQAYREHEMIEEQQPISQYQMAQAQQHVQQVQEEVQEYQQAIQSGQVDPNDPSQAPQNPDTGQPFEDPQDFEQWAQHTMQQAMIMPGLVDNHAVHIDVHSRVVKGLAFNNYPVEVQTAFMDHISQHREIMFSYPASVQPIPPKVNLQIKSTVGPTVQSEILKKAGIFTTPEENAEPPLETWVTEQVAAGQNTDGSEKPGMPADTGAGPALSQMVGHAASSQMQQGAHHQSQQIAQAKATAGLLDQHAKAQQQVELHHHRLRAAQAQADAAQAKARIAANPPKPAGGK